jgi:hypothetical protein
VGQITETCAPAAFSVRASCHTRRSNGRGRFSTTISTLLPQRLAFDDGGKFECDGSGRVHRQAMVLTSMTLAPSTGFERVDQPVGSDDPGIIAGLGPRLVTSRFRSTAAPKGIAEVLAYQISGFRPGS